MRLYTIYGRSNCPFCDKAKTLLFEEGLAYHYVPLDSHTEHLGLFKYAGFSTVPQVFSPEGNLIGGYTELKEHFSNDSRQDQPSQASL